MDTGAFPPSTLERRLPRYLVASGASTVLLGLVAFWDLFQENYAVQGGHAAATLLFDLARLLLLDAPAEGEPPRNVAYSLARITAVFTAALGITFIVLSLYREGAEQWKLKRLAWKARRSADNRHTVLCGLGRVGRQLVEDLYPENARPGARLVVIERDPLNPWVEAYRRRGVIVLVGDVADAALRSRARLDLASEVVIACGDDALNLNVAAALPENLERTSVLKCYIHLATPQLTHVARAHDVFAGRSGHVEFHVFNMLENAARELLRGEGGLARPPHAPMHEREVAYYILFGFGQSGQHVALQMGKLAHFRNRKRLRLSIVDDFGEHPADDPLCHGFLDRYPAFCPDPHDFDLGDHVQAEDPAKDAWTYRGPQGTYRPLHAAWRSDDPQAVEYAVNAEFLSMRTEVDAPDLIEELVRRLAGDPVTRIKPGIVVCFEEDRRNFEAALRVSAALEREGFAVPVYVYLPEEEGLASLLHLQQPGVSARQHEQLRKVYPFGMRKQTAQYRHIVRPVLQPMAEAIHAAYEEHQARKHAAARERIQREAEAAQAAGTVPPEVPEPYHPTPYAELHPDYRASNEEAAAHAVIKLDAVGCEARSAVEATPDLDRFVMEDHLELLAEVEHNRWMAERLLTGWRFGPRDSRRKHRETLCAWPLLAEPDREKDREAVRQLVTAYQAAKMIICRSCS